MRQAACGIDLVEHDLFLHMKIQTDTPRLDLGDFDDVAWEKY